MDDKNGSFEIPHPPRRVINATDWLFLLATPVMMYFGGVAAATGNASGLVLVGFAGLALITLRTVRVGRRNEPRVQRWSGPGSIFVAVFSFVWSWSLFQSPLSKVPEQLIWPILPVALYGILILVMFAPRRVR